MNTNCSLSLSCMSYIQSAVCMLSGGAWNGTPLPLSRQAMLRQKGLFCCPGDVAGGCPLHRRAALPLPCQLWADDVLPLQLRECWEASGGSCPSFPQALDRLQPASGQHWGKQLCESWAAFTQCKWLPISFYLFQLINTSWFLPLQRFRYYTVIMHKNILLVYCLKHAIKFSWFKSCNFLNNV